MRAGARALGAVLYAAASLAGCGGAASTGPAGSSTARADEVDTRAPSERDPGLVVELSREQVGGAAVPSVEGIGEDSDASVEAPPMPAMEDMGGDPVPPVDGPVAGVDAGLPATRDSTRGDARGVPGHEDAQEHR